MTTAELIQDLTVYRTKAEADLTRLHVRFSEPLVEFGLGHRISLQYMDALRLQARRDTCVTMLELLGLNPTVFPKWLGSTVDSYMGRAASALTSECADAHRLALVGEYDVLRIALQHVHPEMLVPNADKSTQVKGAKRPKK